MSSPHDLRPVGTKNIFFLQNGPDSFPEQFKPFWIGNYAFVLIDAEDLVLLDAGERVLLDAEELVLLDAGERVLLDAEDLVLFDAGEPVLLDAEDLVLLDAGMEIDL